MAVPRASRPWKLGWTRTTWCLRKSRTVQRQETARQQIKGKKCVYRLPDHWSTSQEPPQETWRPKRDTAMPGADPRREMVIAETVTACQQVLTTSPPPCRPKLSAIPGPTHTLWQYISGGAVKPMPVQSSAHTCHAAGRGVSTYCSHCRHCACTYSTLAAFKSHYKCRQFT